MKIGYACGCKGEKSLELQRQALKDAGCEVIYHDYRVSDAAVGRPGLAKTLAKAEPGDVLVVWKLDRVGRSLRHLIKIITGLGKAGIGFQSLEEQIDTRSGDRRLYLHVLEGLAKFEDELMSKRTKAGMAAARRSGKRMGKPRKLAPHQVARAHELIEMGEERHTVAALFGVGESTLRRVLPAALMSEETRAGMAGKRIARPRKLTADQVAHARELIESGKETRIAVAARFGVSVITLRKALLRAAERD